MDTITKIKALCKAKGIKISHLERNIGTYQGFLANVSSGKNRLTEQQIMAISKILGVTTAYLLGNDLDSLESDSTPSKLHKEKGEKVAVYSTVGAGIPMEAINTFDQDDPDSWEEISRIDASRGEYFALRVRGNSMDPLIRHGDIVIVRKQDEYNDGDIVIALVNGNEGVCKILEYRNNGGIALLSINPDFPPMTFNAEQIENLPVRIMGRCVERRGRL